VTGPDRYLTPAQAAAVYDRIGRWQDTQGFYERRAVEAMVRAGRFERATAVVEVGCGTGGLAARLLSDHLPADATYRALDVSATMVRLTEDRLAQWPGRATVSRIDGISPWPTPDASADRVVAAYVLDLLSPAALMAFFVEAGRVMRPGGLVATVSLTPGGRGLPAVVSDVWTRLWRLYPRLTGGCRPVDPAAALPSGWRIHTDLNVTAWNVSSRVLVAEPPG
jgi:ubiquinone/menaquinone biosynthesis C-methylase UbiE